MNTSPLFASKIFTVAVSISIVLCSLSLLLFSINHISAAKAENSGFAEKAACAAPWDEGLKGAVGLGIVNNTGYFIVWGAPSNMFYKVDLSKARDWYAD